MQNGIRLKTWSHLPVLWPSRGIGSLRWSLGCVCLSVCVCLHACVQQLLSPYLEDTTLLCRQSETPSWVISNFMHILAERRNLPGTTWVPFCALSLPQIHCEPQQYYSSGASILGTDAQMDVRLTLILYPANPEELMPQSIF